MKKTIFLFLALFAFITSNSQNTKYTIREYENAIKKQTRSLDGNPGINYFSNYSDYKIEAEFDTKTGLLTGKETVIYHNQSPDTLQIIVIRLYQNLFAKGFPRDFTVNSEDLTDGVIISKLVINGKEINIRNTRTNSTNMFVPIPDKILPDSETELLIEWQLSYPEHTTVRNGKYMENVWFIGYWYPQIAVYDDVFGWDNSTYTGSTEFYNDHSNFDVKITVPYPNLLWATGEQQNIDDVYTKKYANRIKDAKNNENVVNIITPDDYEQGKILINKDKNTWHFIASKVPDFSFATSDKHNWDGVGLELPNHSNKVFISGVYLDTTKFFHNLAKISKDIIKTYSFKLPGILFPYPKMTVFQGGGGMEYPMMVNESSNNDICDDYYVTAHEIAHSYFPFLVGSSESKYAWMDEGLITYFPRLVVDILQPQCISCKKVQENYSRDANGFYDLPLIMPTNVFKDFWAYRVIAYNKSSFALQQLNKYLGDSLFFGGLQEYAKRWGNKHPYPWDFFNTFDDYTGENLCWFWNAYFFEFNYPDLSISEAKYKKDLTIIIKNIGGLPIPIELEIELTDGQIISYKEKADCWKDENIHKIVIQANAKPKNIKITGNNPDTDIKNNFLSF